MSRFNPAVLGDARRYVLGLCCEEPKIAGYPQEDPILFICLRCGGEQRMT